MVIYGDKPLCKVYLGLSDLSIDLLKEKLTASPRELALIRESITTFWNVFLRESWYLCIRGVIASVDKPSTLNLRKVSTSVPNFLTSHIDTFVVCLSSSGFILKCTRE